MLLWFFLKHFNCLTFISIFLKNFINLTDLCLLFYIFSGVSKIIFVWFLIVNWFYWISFYSWNFNLSFYLIKILIYKFLFVNVYSKLIKLTVDNVIIQRFLSQKMILLWINNFVLGDLEFNLFLNICLNPDLLTYIFFEFTHFINFFPFFLYIILISSK